MSGIARQLNYSPAGAMIFRIALFAAAASLAAYIPFKYVTNPHAMQGLYAFLFPLSGILALTGMVLAVKPRTGCSCGDIDVQSSIAVRSGIGAIALLWMVNGALCIPTLAAIIQHSVWGGAFAAVHLTAQHIFLSSSILAFAFAPFWMAQKLGVSTDISTAPTKASDRIMPV